MGDRKSSRCFVDSDDEELFHSRFTSEKPIDSSSSMVNDDALSFNTRENKKSNNLKRSNKKRKRLTLMNNETNNNSLNLDNNDNGNDRISSRIHNKFNETSRNFVSQDFVLAHSNMCNGSDENYFFPPNDVSIEFSPNIPETNFLSEDDDFADIPLYTPSMSVKLKEITIGNYNSLNPGLLSLNPTANSICIELQVNNGLDRIDFHVKGIQDYHREKNVIQLNLVHDWIKYLLPVREVPSSKEIKIKFDPTEGELRRTGCIKLFPENCVNTNVFGQEFRKMRNASKPPISAILQWEETKFEVIINYNRRRRYIFVMEETTLQEFLLIVRKKFNSPRINLPFRYLLDEPEVIHIFNEESWKNFKLTSFHRQNQDFKKKKSLVLHLKDDIG